MTIFTTFKDLPVEIKQDIRRIQAIDSSARTTAEAAVLAAYADAIANEIIDKNAAGEIVRAQGITLPTGLSGFAKSAVFAKSDVAAGTKALYENTGDSTTAAWNLIGDIVTADIGDGQVTLAKLAAGVTPSHVVKYAGTFTTAGGAAVEDHTITGVAATDVVIATINTVGTVPVVIVAAKTATNKITITFAADPSTDHVINYVVYRAAA